jgi:hypothetical protein
MKRNLPFITGNRSMRNHLTTVGCWAVLALMALPGTTRAADERPYKGRLRLNIVEVTDLGGGFISVVSVMKGRATSLGRFTGYAFYEIDLATGEFEGTAVKVAANGDELYEEVSGQFTDPLMTASVGEFVVVGGTGRFENAAGEGEFAGASTTDTEIAITLRGVLSYDASDRANSSPPGSNE